jgi:hypothetical protein
MGRCTMASRPLDKHVRQRDLEPSCLLSLPSFQPDGLIGRVGGEDHFIGRELMKSVFDRLNRIRITDVTGCCEAVRS